VEAGSNYATCKDCRKGDSVELIKNREGYLVGKTHRECTACNTIFEITSKTVVLCKPCNSLRVKATGEVGKMLARAKQRARDKGLEFDLTAADVVIPSVCPILGMPLEHKKGSPGGAHNSPALDRIDNTKGYVRGNVIVISHLANMMKSSATPEQLLKFADWVYSSYPRQGLTPPVEHN
jgi:hypothetical protein